MKVGVFAAFVATLAVVALADGKAHSFVETAAPASTIDFGTALKMYYNAFQKIMPCGYPAYNIPVLAPFTKDVWSFNVQSQDYKINGSYSNLVITGLDDWRVLDLSYDPKTQRTSIDMIYSGVQVLAETSVDAWILVAGFPVTGAYNGPMNSKLVDFRLVGDFVFAPSADNSNGLQITNFNFNFYIGDVISRNFNNNWDIAGNNFANKWIRDSLMMWVQQIQVQVDQYASELLLPMLNHALENVSMNQLVNFFVQQTELWNNADCTVA